MDIAVTPLNRQWTRAPSMTTTRTPPVVLVLAAKSTAVSSRFIYLFASLLLFSFCDKLWSQVSSLLPPGSHIPSVFAAHRVQHSHCSSIFHRMLLTHALAFSVGQFVHKKQSLRIYTSMLSGGLELTQVDLYLVYTWYQVSNTGTINRAIDCSRNR